MYVFHSYFQPGKGGKEGLSFFLSFLFFIFYFYVLEGLFEEIGLIDYR